MLRVKLLLLLFLLSIAQGMEGQNITKGFAKLEKGDVKKAKEIFKDAIKSKKDVAVAYYGLALCQCDTTAEKAKPSFTDAYKSLLEANKRMNEADEATIASYRKKYGFGAEKIADKMAEMAGRELFRIYYTKNLSAFASYLKTFKGLTTFTEAARERYESIRWEKAAKTNTVDAYEELKKKPIDSVYIAMADSAIEHLHWTNAVEHESLKLFDKYEKLYPNSDKDSLIAKARYDIRLNELLSKKGEGFYLSSFTEQKYLDFLSSYPDSPERDTILYLAGKSAYNYALMGISFSRNSRVLDVNALDVQQGNTYSVLKDVLKRYPNHPHAARVRERLREQLYERGKKESQRGRVSESWAFYYELYPDGEHIAEIDQHLKDMAKKYYDLCDYDEIGLFESVCPKDYPNRPKDWERRQEVAVYIYRNGIWGEEKDLVSTIKYCAPYEPAFWALREMLVVEHDENDITILRRYMPLLPHHKAVIQRMINTLSASATKVDWRCIGDSINSPLYEYCASFSANGRYLYFSRKDADKEEQIWVSTKENDSWGTPRYCSTINIPTDNCDPQTLYPNGNEIVFFHNGTLKLARKSDEGKMEATREKLPFNVGQWNGDVQFTFDGNAALFCTSSGDIVGLNHHPWRNYMGMPGANIDIFVCLKDSLGNWGKPVNLGPVINTPFIDRSPFLASDMRTLYFASNRHGSMSNELDVFMSKRLKDDSWTEWSEPVNLGRGINSVADDWQLNLSADGSTMYISKNQDLFEADVPNSMRPDPVTLLYGKIESLEGEKVIGYVRWEDLTTGKKMGEMQADIETGEYFVTLPHGKHYAYYVYKDNYVAESGNVFVDKSEKKVKRIRRDVVLATKEQVLSGKVEVRMNNVFFNSNSADIDVMSDFEIKRVFNFLKENDFPLIELSGHTDNKGSDEANLVMSQKRAEAVKARLVELGYNPDRISAVGYGNSMPKADNDSEEGRSLNRRVEMKIVK